MTEAYIFDALRTPRGIGKNSGALYEVRPIELLKTVMVALQTRHNLDTAELDDYLIGNNAPIGEQGGNIARSAALYAGWDVGVPGAQLNRFCSSGLETINMAASKIRSGWEDLIVAGGVESMSRVPMASDGGAMFMDPMVSQAIAFVPQGVSADLIATMAGFSRADLDEFALLSQQRALSASAEGYFKSSIVPVKDQNGIIILEEDELLRPDTTLEILSRLPASFANIGARGFDAVALKKYYEIEKIKHLHHAGNSAGLVDGASLALIGSAKKGKALGIKPRARIRSVALAGVDPTIMLTGSIPATHKALKKAGMSLADIDLMEVNESFSAVVLNFMREMGIDNLDTINVNGGAIALGNPIGATGAMLLGTLLDELERRDLTTGLVTMCTIGGMGISTIIERV